jgi:molybdenum cofactor synthesis domain-containing protein
LIAHILSIGNEILIGDTVNTNATWMAARLTAVGVHVQQVLTIGDSHSQIMDALRTSTGVADLLLITGGLGPTRDDITKAALAALLAVCHTNDNPDIRPAIPAVVHAISKPADTYKAVEELMATTFVATVDASTLSILCPILSRGLKEKNALRKRSCCVVIENMSRLVDSPNAVAPFGPLLVPELKKVVENVQFEDIRDVALSALQALTRALGHADIEAAVSAIMREEAERAEAEQKRIEEALEEEKIREEEMRLKEEEERKQFKEAMEAQRLLEKLELEEEEAKKQKEMLKKEQLKKSTKTAGGKCQGCGLKKCKKTCLFYKE